MGKYSPLKRSGCEENSETKLEEGFTCQICIEPIPPNRKLKTEKSCDHPFCVDCIAYHIEAKIEEKVANIRCPGLYCDQLLDPLSCRPIIRPSLFSKWCDLLCDSYVRGFEGSECPNRNCMAWVVNECRETVTKTKCPSCKQFFCFQCKLMWHAGYRCEETEHLRDRNDILFGELVEANSWMRCPGCGQCVEHIDGCASMECTRCKTCFCYICGGNLSTRDVYRCDCGRAFNVDLLLRRLGFFFLYLCVVIFIAAVNIFL